MACLTRPIYLKRPSTYYLATHSIYFAFYEAFTQINLWKTIKTLRRNANIANSENHSNAWAVFKLLESHCTLLKGHKNVK